MSILLQVTEISKLYKNQTRPGLDHVSFSVKKANFWELWERPVPENYPLKRAVHH